jgi:hypothetical protein
LSCPVFCQSPFSFSGWPGNYFTLAGIALLHFNCHIWTNESTYGAAGAVGVIRNSWEITISVGLFGYDDTLFRTDYYTQAAALASLGIDYYFASHFKLKAF